jgi:hypothetical protein
VHAGPTFVAHGQPTESMEPGHGAFDDPPRASETTAMVGAALGELGANAPAVEQVAMRLRVIGAVALNQSGLAHRPPGTATQRRERVDQREQFGDVVPAEWG